MNIYKCVKEKDKNYILGFYCSEWIVQIGELQAEIWPNPQGDIILHQLV